MVASRRDVTVDTIAEGIRLGGGDITLRLVLDPASLLASISEMDLEVDIPSPSSGIEWKSHSP